jgi:hypothetical protein
MKRQPDGTFRGVRQPVKLSEASIRTRWIEGELLKLKRIGVSFDDLAVHITQVGRGQIPPRTPFPEGLVFPPKFTFSRQAAHKRWKKSISREPAINVEEYRKENNARAEELWMYLQPAIRKCDPQAINSAVKVLAHQAKLNGCYGPTKHDGAGDEVAISPITTLLAEIGPIDDDEQEKRAG